DGDALGNVDRYLPLDRQVVAHHALADPFGRSPLRARVFDFPRDRDSFHDGSADLLVFGYIVHGVSGSMVATATTTANRLAAWLKRDADLSANGDRLFDDARLAHPVGHNALFLDRRRDHLGVLILDFFHLLLVFDDLAFLRRGDDLVDHRLPGLL